MAQDPPKLWQSRATKNRRAKRSQKVDEISEPKWLEDCLGTMTKQIRPTFAMAGDFRHPDSNPEIPSKLRRASSLLSCSPSYDFGC